MSEQELFKLLLDHHYWFYSTIAQSLSALIGIVGVFAIFKIQLLVNIIESKARGLEELVKTDRWVTHGIFESEPLSDTIENNMKEIIKDHTRKMEKFENTIQRNIKDSKDRGEDIGTSNNAPIANKKETQNRIKILKKYKSDIDKPIELKHRITHSAKILIASFILLLIGSSICLALVKDICQSSYWSKALIPLTIVLLLGALYLLFRLCWISLKTETDEVTVYAPHIGKIINV